MTKNQFRKKCKSQKIKGYRLLWAGEIAAVICIVLMVTGLLLGNKDIISFDVQMLLFLIGGGFALLGIILYFTGERIALRTVKAYARKAASNRSSKVKRQKSFTLENQNGRIEKFSDGDICNYLEEMFISPDQFVALTAPKAKEKVRFVQACMQDGYVELQLGLEEKENVLVSKRCSREECTGIFLAFYKGEFVPYLYEYQPVQF